METVPENEENLYRACGSEKHKIKYYKSKRNIYITDLKRNQIIKHKLRKKLEKYGEVNIMRVRQDKHGKKGNIAMACLATEEQPKLAINILNKTKQYVENEYKHKKHTNNLNSSKKKKDKRYKMSA